MTPVALVTGGGRGLGIVLAETLVAAGYAVALVGRDARSLERAVEELGGPDRRVLAIPADVSDAVAVARAVREVEATLGSLDVLVNNAAVTTYGRLVDCTADAWWRVFEVNVRGPFLCSRAVLPGMIERRSGRIVNVASGAGGVASQDGQSAYHASKAAVFRLTDCLAAEVETQGVRVFGISPGLLETDMGREAERRRERAGPAPWVSSSRAAELLAAIVSGRLDVLNGRVLDARDGFVAISAQRDEIVARDLAQLRIRPLLST